MHTRLFDVLHDATDEGHARRVAQAIHVAFDGVVEEAVDLRVAAMKPAGSSRDSQICSAFTFITSTLTLTGLWKVRFTIPSIAATIPTP